MQFPFFFAREVVGMILPELQLEAACIVVAINPDITRYSHSALEQG